MADKKGAKGFGPGDIIAVVFGLPMMVMALVVWSPFMLIGAVLALFSEEKPVPTDTNPGKQPMSKGAALLISAGLFAVFVFLLSLKSGGGKGAPSPSSRSAYGGSAPSPSAYGGSTSQPSLSGRSVWVNGYHRRDGTYVPAHYRTSPDGDRSNNWSTSPNVNPYTGRRGTRRR